MSDSITESRKDPRASATFEVRLRSASVGEFVARYASDISVGGMFVRSDEPMKIGTLLRIEFNIEDGRAAAHGVGRVVWFRAPAEATPERPAGMGVKFVKMDTASRKLVAAFVEARAGAAGHYDRGPEGHGGGVSLPAPVRSRKATIVGLPDMSSSHPPAADTSNAAASFSDPAPADLDDDPQATLSATSKHPDSVETRSNHDEPLEQASQSLDPPSPEPEPQEQEAAELEQQEPKASEQEAAQPEEQEPEEQEPEEREPEVAEPETAPPTSSDDGGSDTGEIVPAVEPQAATEAQAAAPKENRSKKKRQKRGKSKKQRRANARSRRSEKKKTDRTVVSATDQAAVSASGDTDNAEAKKEATETPAPRKKKATTASTRADKNVPVVAQRSSSGALTPVLITIAVVLAIAAAAVLFGDK